HLPPSKWDLTRQAVSAAVEPDLSTTNMTLGHLRAAAGSGARTETAKDRAVADQARRRVLMGSLLIRASFADLRRGCPPGPSLQLCCAGSFGEALPAHASSPM